MVDDWERQYLDNLRRATDEARHFFSNSMKPERERAICRAFLRGIGVDFVDNDIKAASREEEPVDVFFSSARFQMREILDAKYKRTDEWRNKAELLKSATCIDDLKEPTMSSKAMTFPELYSFICDALQKKSVRYGAEREKLDMLVYVNLQDRFLAEHQIVTDLEALKAQGWRSASMLFVPFASVLYANVSAPDFLRERAGCVLNKWPHPEGWFEPTE
jgi:hypothetical protein